MEIKQLFMAREGETKRTTYGPIRVTTRYTHGVKGGS